MPVDEDGLQCVIRVALPEDAVCGMAAGLRESVVRVMEADVTDRELAVGDLCSRREKELTEGAWWCAGFGGGCFPPRACPMMRVRGGGVGHLNACRGGPPRHALM